MPQYVGFSTKDACKPKTTNALTGLDGGPGSIVKPIVFGKKFRMVDTPLVIQDFLNALNIRQGEKVGQPGYGTTLWSFVFEPNTSDVQQQLETELKRVANLDPRLQVGYIKAFPKENGILVEMSMAVTPFNQPLTLNVFFNATSGRATIQ